MITDYTEGGWGNRDGCQLFKWGTGAALSECSYRGNDQQQKQGIFGISQVLGNFHGQNLGNFPRPMTARDGSPALRGTMLAMRPFGGGVDGL